MRNYEKNLPQMYIKYSAWRKQKQALENFSKWWNHRWNIHNSKISQVFFHYSVQLRSIYVAPALRREPCLTWCLCTSLAMEFTVSGEAQPVPGTITETFLFNSWLYTLLLLVICIFKLGCYPVIYLQITYFWISGSLEHGTVQIGSKQSYYSDPCFIFSTGGIGFEPS